MELQHQQGRGDEGMVKEEEQERGVPAVLQPAVDEEEREGQGSGGKASGKKAPGQAPAVGNMGPDGAL